MKLLIITQKIDINDPVLGFFHRWVQEFARHCERVTVIALSVGDHSLPDNVRVLSLGKERGAGRLAYLLNFYRFILQERARYDAVFVHMNPIYVILGALPWRIWGKKMGLWYTHKYVDVKLRLAVVLADRIFTASAESLRVRSRKAHIVGHGIDTEVCAPRMHSRGNTFRITTTGRISSAKGYDTLIATAGELVARGVFFSISIAGAPATVADERYAEELRAQVKEHGLESYIHWAGGIPHADIPRFLAEADVFVNMSKTGSVDKAVLEAMACGVPTITSNEAFPAIFGGLAEELMFPAGDAHALTEKLLAFAGKSAHERRDLGAQLRAIVVRDHNISTLISRIMNEYETSR